MMRSWTLVTTTPTVAIIRASQHLAKTLQPLHPSFDLVISTNATAMRGKKSRLRSSCWSTVAPFLTKGTVPPGELKNVLSDINMKIIEDSINRLGMNKVLQAHPLPSTTGSVSFHAHYGQPSLNCAQV